MQDLQILSDETPVQEILDTCPKALWALRRVLCTHRRLKKSIIMS
jgi:hypothetical protein